MKKLLIYSVLFSELAFSRSPELKQVIIETETSMNIPIVGKIEMINTFTAAEGYFHQYEEIKYKNFFTRLLIKFGISSSSGTIYKLEAKEKITYTENEYSIMPFHEIQDTVKSENNVLSVQSNTDDKEKKKPNIRLSTSEELEEVNGFMTKRKTIEIMDDNEEPVLIIESWIVDEILEVEFINTVYQSMFEAIGFDTPAPLSDETLYHLLIMEVIKENELEQNLGYPVKMVVQIVDDEDNVNFVNQIKSINTVQFNVHDFDIPKGMKLKESE